MPASLYAKAKFAVDVSQMANLQICQGIAGVVVQCILLPVLLRLIATRRILQLGLVGQTASSVLIAIATTNDVLMTGYGVQGLASLVFPAVAAVRFSALDIVHLFFV